MHPRICPFDLKSQEASLDFDRNTNSYGENKEQTNIAINEIRGNIEVTNKNILIKCKATQLKRL